LLLLFGFQAGIAVATGGYRLTGRVEGDDCYWQDVVPARAHLLSNPNNGSKVSDERTTENRLTILNIKANGD